MGLGGSFGFWVLPLILGGSLGSCWFLGLVGALGAVVWLLAVGVWNLVVLLVVFGVGVAAGVLLGW